jgi:hypothetical protein
MSFACLVSKSRRQLYRAACQPKADVQDSLAGLSFAIKAIACSHHEHPDQQPSRRSTGPFKEEQARTNCRSDFERSTRSPACTSKTYAAYARNRPAVPATVCKAVRYES